MEKVVERIESIKETDRTFNNTILPLAHLEADYIKMSSGFYFYSQVSTNATVRAGAPKVSNFLANAIGRLYKREDLLSAITHYVIQAGKNGELKKLNRE